MARTRTQKSSTPVEATPDTRPLHIQILEGLNVKSRKDGSVHTIKDANGKTVAEVCVGKKRTRLNFRTVPSGKGMPKGIDLGGKSKSWQGGGVVLNEANVGLARELLVFVVGTAPEPTAADAAEALAASQAQADIEAARVAELAEATAAA